MLKLIIADDEVLVLKHLSKILPWEELGITITGLYTDGSQVLTHLMKESADIIISDVKMPFADGLEIAKYCSENHPETDVILISAFREFHYAQTAIKYGVVSFITKPYTKQSIMDALLKIINKKNPVSEVSNDFSSIIKYQTFFWDIFYGNISTADEISQTAQELKLFCDSGKIIQFEIENYNNYINKEWKYGESRFFNAISSLAFSKTNNSCCSVVCLEKKLFLIIILSEDNDFINTYINKLSSSFKSFLNVDVSISSEESFSHLSDLVGHLRISINDGNDFLKRAEAFIAENFTKDITLDDAARALCLNKTYFCVLYKKYTNETFVETLKRLRLEKAKDLVIKSDVKISLIYELVGYKSKPYFYKLFKEQFGLTPIEYRQIYGNTGINDLSGQEQ